MSAYHCPICPLIFQFRTEVAPHIRDEHRSRTDEDAALRVELNSANGELDWTRLRALQSSTTDPSVSLIMATTPAAAMTSLDVALLRRLANRARRRLDAEPGAGSTLRHRLARAVAAAEGNPTDRGLVVLVSARQLALFRLPFEPRDRVVVDPTFATRDLEVTLRHWPRYRVLVLGPSPRILEGRGRHLADTKRLGIDSGPPALFGAAGRGLGRRSPRPEHWIGRRARHIAGRCQAERLLDERTAVSGVLPLIAIGDDRWLTEFRQHSHHTPNVIGEVRGNRTRSSPLRLAELARPVLARWHLAEQTNQLAALEHADGHGGVAWGLDAAWRAIQHGDADHLWVEVSFARPGRRLPDGEGIQTTTDPEAPGALDDLVDDLIEAAGIGGMRVDLVDDGRLGPPEPIAVHLLAGDHTRSRPASLAAA